MVLDPGAACVGASARTAIGPSSETMAAASGSVVFRHWQSGLGFAGWCIGHWPFALCAHVQLIASAACGECSNSESGAAVSNDS